MKAQRRGRGMALPFL